MKNLMHDAIDVGLHRANIIEYGSLKIPDPEHGDVKLSIYPFEHTGKQIKLPACFSAWDRSINEIMRHVPLQSGANTHYVTIDSKFFVHDDFLRREGVHVDGNFCVDPKFRSWRDPALFKASWGGGRPKPGWAGIRPKDGILETRQDNSHVEMDWVLPYKMVFPVGDYISHKKGGIFTVSTEVGCQAWEGEFVGEILSEGSFKDIEMSGQLTDDRKIIFKKDTLYFMTSNTPHETLMINKGKRRTFIRITLNHNYDNAVFLK